MQSSQAFPGFSFPRSFERSKYSINRRFCVNDYLYPIPPRRGQPPTGGHVRSSHRRWIAGWSGRFHPSRILVLAAHKNSIVPFSPLTVASLDISFLDKGPRGGDGKQRELTTRTFGTLEGARGSGRLINSRRGMRGHRGSSLPRLVCSLFSLETRPSYPLYLDRDYRPAASA